MCIHGVGESTIQTSRLVLIVGISLLALGFILGYGTATLAPAPEARSDEERVIELAVDFLESSPTFEFDGIEDSIEVGLVASTRDFPASLFSLTVTFTSTHPGYGDRSDQILAQVLTDHEIAISIRRIGSSSNFEIQSAEIDGVWDEVTQSGISIGVNELLGEEWILSSFVESGEEISLSQARPTITFDESGMVNGFGGCNQYSGSYEISDDGTLTFGLLASTLRACMMGDDVEMFYYASLAEPMSIVITSDELELSSNLSSTILKFVRNS